MDLGQEALKQELSNRNSAHDSEQEIGLLDLNDASGKHDNVISIAHIFRAEDNLGHAIINPEDVRDAHIGHADNVIQHLFKTVKNYSIDDTQTEQNGGPSDADVTTAGGWLKQGMQDPDAHESKKIKKRMTSDLRLINQQTEQDTLTRQLAELDILIEESKERIEALEEHLSDIHDIQEMLENNEDIDGSSPEARGARRKISKILSQHGKTLSDYTDENGVIDQQKLQDDLERMRQESIAEQAAEQARLAALEDRKEEIESRTDITANREEIRADNHADVEHAIETGNTEAIEQYAQDPTNTHARPPALLQEEEKQEFIQEHITANNEAPDEGMGLLAFFGFGDEPEDDMALAANEQSDDASLNETQELASAAPTERSFGSFAALSDIKDSLVDSISSAFSQASDPETTKNAETIAPAEITEEYAQQDNAQQQRTMSV
ncbi:MAG: hypothetical protein COB36_11850 [Alphaproteobacteria bacterium]|nr:MAG: hypothetical protein COB36_11850 [Alphaproteobacteria bacterium]